MNSFESLVLEAWIVDLDSNVSNRCYKVMIITMNILWAVVFSIFGALVGIGLVFLATRWIPRIVDRMTPNIDETKEMLRGNRAVADYYSRICAASILGVSLVVAAAILGGIIAGLH